MPTPPNPPQGKSGRHSVPSHPPPPNMPSAHIFQHGVGVDGKKEGEKPRTWGWQNTHTHTQKQRKKNLTSIGRVNAAAAVVKKEQGRWSGATAAKLFMLSLPMRERKYGTARRGTHTVAVVENERPGEH